MSAQAPKYVESAKVKTPAYDPAAVGRVALRVEILTIELVGSTFSRSDASALPVRDAVDERIPEVQISADYKLSRDHDLLGCLLSFRTSFAGRKKAPYEITAEFRILYSVTGEGALAADDLRMFAHYNGVFNAWPYWREYLSSLINRGQLPRFVLPVFRIPRPKERS